MKGLFFMLQINRFYKWTIVFGSFLVFFFTTPLQTNALTTEISQIEFSTNTNFYEIAVPNSFDRFYVDTTNSAGINDTFNILVSQLDTNDNLLGSEVVSLPAYDQSYIKLNQDAEKIQIELRSFINQWAETDFSLGLEFHWLRTTELEPTSSTSNLSGINIASRAEWGCYDHVNGGSPSSVYYCGNPFWSSEILDPTHIIVHHTATSNSETNWAAAVQSIWYHHSHIRDADPDDGVSGWTDIGYNYLIDPNGVIYEGRNGGHGVTGGHTIGHNRGTVGIALIGDYNSTTVTDSTRLSLEALIQAILDRENLNPYESAVTLGGTSNNRISGHRDWTATACPGNAAYSLLDSLALRPGIAEGDSSSWVYRFFNRNKGSHFYTISEGQKNRVIANFSDTWTAEGVAFKAFTKRVEGTSPVYRFFSPSLGSHFYTTSDSVKARIESEFSSDIWVYEGVAFYAYKESDVGRNAVHQFWSGIVGSHFYTASEGQKSRVEREYSDVWQYEKVAYYVEN